MEQLMKELAFPEDAVRTVSLYTNNENLWKK